VKGYGVKIRTCPCASRGTDISFGDLAGNMCFSLTTLPVSSLRGYLQVIPFSPTLLRASGLEFDYHNVMRRPGVVHRIVRDRLPHDDYLATVNRSRSRASVWESKGKFAICNANSYQTRMSVHN